MTTQDQRMALQPITELLTQMDHKDEESRAKVADMISDYVDRTPLKAIALEVLLVSNMASSLGMAMPKTENGERLTVNLQTASFTQKGEEVPRDAAIDFVWHLVEHWINDEVEDVYDHLLEIADNGDIFMNTVSASVMLYIKVLGKNRDKESRLMSVKMTEDGIEVIAEEGNQSIGSPAAFRRPVVDGE